MGPPTPGGLHLSDGSGAQQAVARSRKPAGAVEGKMGRWPSIDTLRPSRAKGTSECDGDEVGWGGVGWGGVGPLSVPGLHECTQRCAGLSEAPPAGVGQRVAQPRALQLCRIPAGPAGNERAESQALNHRQKTN
jgi:hypothetical protein